MIKKIFKQFTKPQEKAGKKKLTLLENIAIDYNIENYSKFIENDMDAPANIINHYFLLESQILKKYKNLRHNDIRNQVYHKYANVINASIISIVFKSSNEQQELISIDFIKRLLHRATNLYGSISNNHYKDIYESLKKYPAVNLEPLTNMLSLHKSTSVLDLCITLSKNIYNDFIKIIGEEATIRIFNIEYKEIYQIYKKLDYFAILIDLLPEAILDEEKISLMSLKQSQTILFEKISKLKDANKELDTKNKNLEDVQQDLIIARQDAEKANQMKTQFLANMSHEFRTPLTSILGYSEISLYDESLTDKHKRYFTAIKESAEQLSNLVNNFLDISKIESGKYQLEFVRFKPEDLLIVKRTVKPYLQGKKVLLNFQIDTNFPEYIYTDKNKIIQILLNLVSNAIKFTNQGKIIVNIKHLEKESKIHINIKDSGIGMSDEEQKYIFEEFYQIKNETKSVGSGLGLAIVKRLLHILKGDITLKSQKNVGTEFNVYVPLQELQLSILKEEKSFNRELAIDKIAERLKDNHILIAEDEWQLQSLFEEIFKDIPHKIVQDGKEAVDAAEENKPALILMDIMMPNLTGDKALLKIRNFNKIIPIIALTAKALIDEENEILNIGFTDYIKKPINQNELYQKVLKHLQ